MAGALVLPGCGQSPTGMDAEGGGSAADASAGQARPSGSSDDANSAGPSAALEGGAADGSSRAACGSCATGEVCCEPPLGCAGMCVVDCRPTGACPQGLSCDVATGVCSPSADAGMALADGGTMAPPRDGGTGACGACPTGDVCCESPLGCAGMCVHDCRLGGTCPQGLSCDQTSGVCSPTSGGGTAPPSDGGTMPPPPDAGTPPSPDAGTMPPRDAGMLPPPPDAGPIGPPDGGMRPAPDGGGGTMPGRDGGMMPPPDGGGGGGVPDASGGSGGSGGGATDAGGGSGTAPPGIGVLTGDGTGTYPPYSGNNVSMDDTTIVLGDSQANCISGHASVYVWDGVSSWQLQQTFDDPQAGGGLDCFGGSTAVRGDVAFISAPQSGGSEGTIYEYTRSGTTWTETSTVADGTLAGSVSQFGYALAYDGTHLVAGAPAVESNGTTYIGRVDVFTKPGPNWNVQKAIPAPVQIGSGCFGTSLALNGTRLAVGANGGPLQQYSVMGAAYTYTVSGSTWTYEAGAVGQDTQATDGFGQSVALASGSPSLMVVGAPNASANGVQSGAAYVFVFDTGTSQWVQSGKLFPSDGAAGDQFGYTVGALSTTEVVVGSPRVNKAYVFSSASAGVWTQTTIYESCPTNIGWNMATWGTLLVTGKADDVVIDTSLMNPGCGGN